MRKAAADDLLRWALEEVPWRREELRIHGRDVQVPRLVAWFGEPGHTYRYSGLCHTASHWPDVLTTLRERLAETLQCRPNFVLLNRYRSGDDHMGWHTDDEPEMAGRFASISLGAKRRFLARGCGRPSLRFDLHHGSLLVMGGATPHSLPKASSAGERVNLTFRFLRDTGCRS